MELRFAIFQGVMCLPFCEYLIYIYIYIAFNFPLSKPIREAFPKKLIFFLLKFNMVCMFWIVLIC
jgi:hypothetical protein